MNLPAEISGLLFAVFILGISIALLVKKRLDWAINQNQEHKLSSIVQSIEDAILTEDLDARITSWNSAAARVFGYSSEEVIGRSMSILCPDKKQDEETKILKEITKGNNIHNFETTRITKQGKLITVAITLSPLRNRKGVIVGAFKIIRDITEQKIHELKLKEAYMAIQNQKSALDCSAIVAETDSRGRINYVNDKFVELSKYSKDELIGQDHRILNSGYHPKEFFMELWKAIAKGEVWHGEVKNKAKDGTYYWVDTTIYPIRDEEGNPKGYVAIRFDITDKKEMLLKVYNQKTALDCSAIVAETDSRGRITYVNDKFIEISKYTKEELIGQDHRILNSSFHPKEFFIELWKTIAYGQVWHGEVKNKAKDGSHYWVDTTIYPIKDENGKPKGYVAIRFDITDKKEVMHRLEQAKEVADAAAQAKSDFLYTMSHEIRTPLNGIIGTTSLLQETQMAPAQKEFVETIFSSGKTLLSIINDILDASKIDAGKLELEEIEFDFCKQFNELYKPFLFSIKDKDIDLKFQCNSYRNYVVGDDGKIGQVISNLVSNAIKFTKHGSVLVKADLQKRGEHTNIILKVVDTGVGIPEEARKHIFQAFSQAERSTSRHYGGTGLGLSISKRLIEMMGGNISFDSQYGVGTTFTAEFKLKTGEELRDSATIDNLLCEPEIKQISGRILVAEDHTVNQLVISRMLESLGCKYQVVASGREVLSALESTRFDLILMDCQMPEMDGYTASKAIRNSSAAYNQIPILALTANAVKGDEYKCREAGMNEYISKPIEKNKLGIMLRKYLKTAEVAPSTTTINARALRQFEEIERPGRPSILVELINSYIKSSVGEIQRMSEFIRSQKLAELSRLLHTLKSSSRTIGADLLGNLCERTEILINSGQLDLIDSTFESLKHAHAVALKELEIIRAKKIQQKNEEAS